MTLEPARAIAFVLFLALIAGVATAKDPATPATCGGTIVDEQGKPIPGVEVQLYWQNPPNGIMRKSVCRTDDAGRWQMAVAAEVRDVDIHLDHPDYIGDESYRQDKPPMSRLRDGTSVMVMKKALHVSGIVQDETGKPVGNALILPHDRYATKPDGAAVEDSTTARTGADGKFTLGGLPAGPRELTVTAPGYGPEAVPIDVTANMATVQVTMRPGGVFQGLVADQSGKPVNDAGVYCRRWQMQQGHIVSLTGRTDADGRFRIADAPLKGNLEFYVSKKGFLSHTGTVNLPVASCRVALYPPPVISGTVLDDQTDKPVTRFELAEGILSPNSTRPYWNNVEPIQSEEGAFSVTMERFTVGDALPSCAVQIRAAGYVPETIPPVLVGDQPKSYVLRLHRGQPWTGRVRDTADRPAANASVAWIGPQHIAFVENGQLQLQFSASPEWIVRTDPNGRFELPPTKEDGTILVLHNAGYGWWRSNDFRRDSVVRLTSWSRVAGTVHVADSNDHTVQLSLQPADPDWDANDLRIRWFFKATSHVDGTFAFEFIPSIRLAVGTVSEDKFFLADYATPKPGQTYDVEIAAQRSGQTVARSLLGCEFPALDGMAIEPTAMPRKDRRVLLCFFEFQQRPSRNCILQLAKRGGALEQQGVQVVLIQGSKVDRTELDGWLKSNSVPFRVGMIQTDADKTRLAWGVKSLPWLILANKDHIVLAEGFAVDELDQKIKN